jgi:hypothetical protein
MLILGNKAEGYSKEDAAAHEISHALDREIAKNPAIWRALKEPPVSKLSLSKAFNEAYDEMLQSPDVQRINPYFIRSSRTTSLSETFAEAHGAWMEAKQMKLTDAERLSHIVSTFTSGHAATLRGIEKMDRMFAKAFRAVNAGQAIPTR